MDDPVARRKWEALRLILWRFADMMPEGHPPLMLTCGFEREGHFIPPELPELTSVASHWLTSILVTMEEYAKKMHDKLRADSSLGMDYIYYDNAGTFMLEAVTKPLELTQAVVSIKRLSKAMMEQAQAMKLTGNFGELAIADMVDEINRKGAALGISGYAQKAFRNYDDEIMGEGADRQLIGRGLHCNLSVQLDGKNLFAASKLPQLMHPLAAKATEWMPYMFLPYRGSNYHRIARNAVRDYKFSVGNFGSEKAGQLVRYHSDEEEAPDNFEHTKRLEFRQATTGSDPLDVALASALPLLKACEESLRFGADGKLILDNKGCPILKQKSHFPAGQAEAMPASEEEAKLLFNRAENPYFAAIDELAKMRIRKSPPGAQLLEAQECRNLGTKIYADYCEKYGLKNILPKPPAVPDLA